MSRSPYTVGQRVLLLDGNRPTREVTIARIGRTNVYVEVHGRELPFRIDGGVEVMRSDVGGTPLRIATPEQLADEAHRAQVITELKELGIIGDRYGRGLDRYRTATLEAVRDRLRLDEVAR